MSDFVATVFEIIFFQSINPFIFVDVYKREKKLESYLKENTYSDFDIWKRKFLALKRQKNCKHPV